MHPVAALALASAASLLGTLVQWGYGKIGMDLESAMISRFTPNASAPSVSNLILLNAIVCLVGLPLSALLLGLIARRFGPARPPYKTAIAVTSYSL
jgi:hypothetical protein